MSKSAVIHFINNCFCLPNMLVSCKSCRLPQLQSFSALARERTVNLSDPVDTLRVRFSLDPGKSMCHVRGLLIYRGFGRSTLIFCIQ